jgi:hypothetical protein
MSGQKSNPIWLRWATIIDASRSATAAVATAEALGRRGSIGMNGRWKA